MAIPSYVAIVLDSVTVARASLAPSPCGATDKAKLTTVTNTRKEKLYEQESVDT